MSRDTPTERAIRNHIHSAKTDLANSSIVNAAESEKANLSYSLSCISAAMMDLAQAEEYLKEMEE